eukprot:jgi/Mesvir1/18052/Mv09368-RA.2
MHAGVAHPGSLGVPSNERLHLDAAGRVITRHLSHQTMTSWSALYNALRPLISDGHYHQGEALLGFVLGKESYGVLGSAVPSANAQVTSASTHTGKVTSYFSSGRVETSDLLVAADGVTSTVRRLLLPGHEPVYAGYVAYRGVVAESDVLSSAPSMAPFVNKFVFYTYASSQFLVYLIPGDEGSTAAGRRRFNWVWYVPTQPGEELSSVLTDVDGRVRERSIAPGQMPAATREALQERAGRELPLQMRDLVLATAEPFVQPIMDNEVPRMAFGQVAIVGDAAFLVRPHTAASTAKAACDAVALVDALLASATELPSLTNKPCNGSVMKSGGDRPSCKADFDQAGCVAGPQEPSSKASSLQPVFSDGGPSVADVVSNALQRWEPAQLELGRSLLAHGQRLWRGIEDEGGGRARSQQGALLPGMTYSLDTLNGKSL